MRIYPYTKSTGGVVILYQTGAGHESFGVFGVDPALKGVAANHDVGLLDGQLFPCAHANLFLNQVHAGNHLRDRMLYLNTGVHLDEVKAPIFVQELKGTCSAITDVYTGFYAGCIGSFAHIVRNAGSRCFFQHFLVAALQRTVAVAQVNGIALSVRQNLNFHVARVLQEFFHVHSAVAKGSFGFTLGNVDRVQQSCFGVHDAHAATATASCSLDDHGIADATADLKTLFRVVYRQRAVRTGNSGNAGLLHCLDGLYLVTHHADNVGVRADKDKTAFLYLLGKIGVFREETVAGMHSHSVGNLHGADDGWNVQVTFRRRVRADTDGLVRQAHVFQIAVDLGVDSDCLDAHLAAGAQYAQRNFASVGDKNFFKHNQFLKLVRINSVRACLLAG